MFVAASVQWPSDPAVLHTPPSVHVDVAPKLEPVRSQACCLWLKVPWGWPKLTEGRIMAPDGFCFWPLEGTFMRRSRFELRAAGLLCLLAGCTGNTPMRLPVGAEGGPCTVGGGCDPGLLCLSRLCVRPPDSAIPPGGGGAGGVGTGGNAGAGGQAGAGGFGGLGGNGGSASGGVGGSALPDASLGGATGSGGTTGKGGATSSGGNGGLDGPAPTGGAVLTGGTKASGGTVSTGGSSSGGAGGASCANVVPCGGDVVGTWTVTSSCLRVTGQLDMSMLSLGCASASVTGALQVTGTWTAKADGTYSDNTTTSGNEQIILPASCLTVSGTAITCQGFTSLLAALGYEAVSCTGVAGGGCTCSASVAQTGGTGLVSIDAQTSGTYKASGNVVTTDGVARYSYCVSGNRMTWTPQSTSPTTTGTVVFQQGGSTGTGGATSTGGAAGTGGSTGAGGATTPAIRPCDIYAADGGPCVAAHSTIRRLSSTYTGPLYQVRVGGSKSGTGGSTAEIGFLADGFADGTAQDLACGSEVCTISTIYDQSGLGNHLTAAPPGGAKKTADNEANAKALPVTISGHQVYGVKIAPGVGYRNSKAVGTATGDNPETIYMVTSGDYYNGGCCFDYGNAETNNMDNGEGAVEAVYFGSCTIWNKGAGVGPWVMADLENGLWAGDTSPYDPNTSVPASWKYVTGLVKGAEAGKNHWTIKAGNAQSGTLTMPFDGPRPNSRYNPMRKEGAVVLGIAGDNSSAAQGNFFEGLMTAQYSSNAADDAVQANIVVVYGQ